MESNIRQDGKNLPHIDIVTLNYNSEKFYLSYFKSINSIDYPSFSLHLIDNASKDNSLQLIKEKFVDNPNHSIDLHLYESSTNLGFSGGNNLVINKLLKTGSAEYIFLLNQDTEIGADCLRKLVEFVLANPKVGMVDAKQEPKEHPKYYDPSTKDTSWCSGGGVLVRADALREVGVFDDRFFLYCEDIDLSWRMWLHGWRCAFCPEASFRHITEELDEGKDHSLRYFYFVRNGFYMRYKYDSLAGILKYYLAVIALCIKYIPDRARFRNFVKGAIAAQLAVPGMLVSRSKLAKLKRPDWICFNNFEYGRKRPFKDTPEGTRVFV